MILKITAFAFVLLMTTAIFSQIPPLEPGVSQALAKWRAAHYSDVRYKLNITLEKGAPLMKGEIEIRVNLTEEGAKHDLILDWRTTQFQNDKDKPYAKVVSVNDATEVSAVEEKEHLLIPKDLLKTGENVIKIEFASPIKTSGAAVTRYVDKTDGAEYVYSLFVPSDASTAFPVFDQPDLKARFQLNVVAPKDWKVVSNSSKALGILPASRGAAQQITSEEKERNKKLKKRGLIFSEFQETKPISTYVFAFAAGDFEVLYENTVIPVKSAVIQYDLSQDRWTSGNHIYFRKSQAEKFKQHAAEVFHLNREAVKYLESYFDYKFPFPKYDLVLIPEFPFGGMEHAGATFLRESSIIFPSEPTANDYISRANVIFHEAAHQWFGDTVTMRWFDDLWLKEGFAEFMAYKTLEKVMPEYNAWKAFYERNKPLAYLTDSTRGTTPIYQEISNLSAAKSAYGNIVYRKAPSFLRQAEFYLGEDNFQKAVRAFLKKHEYANATWQDLVKEFEAASKQDLNDWANVWVKQRGMPIFKAERITQTTNPQLKIIQSNTFEENAVWRQKVILYEFEKNKNPQNKDLVSINPLNLNQQTKLFSISNADFIFPNHQDYGYGIFLLDEKSREYILKNIQNEKDDFLRSMMWGALWDSVREAELNPKEYVELAVKNISVERDELTIQTILSRVSTAMNYYLSDSQREEIAPKLEAFLLEKMQNAPTVGQRITFYRAFLNVASSENARRILKRFNDPKTDIIQTKGFQLKTKDKFDIVTRLLILGDEDAPRILAELEKTETSDEARRYAYAAKAGIANAENKARFWNDFVNNKEISESWIESAFVPFNSVRHSEMTLPYLEKALAELPNLKRNRKIFFVNGWLSAFIGGQKDEKALQIINKFLADNPNLDRDLRLKILENLDTVERAVKIRAKFSPKNR
jgi:Aminopeptidase N